LGTLRSHHAPLGRLLACHFATHGKPKPFDVWLATISIDGWIIFRKKKTNFIPLDLVVMFARPFDKKFKIQNFIKKNHG
jgi:hypothetical protein